MSDELPEDPRLADLLDDYVARLQRGERPDRDALLREHPGLRSALICLEALENIAPPSEGSSRALRGDETGGSTAPEGLSGLADVPCRFGDYELLEELGRGGMGVVYKARQPSLDRTVAIKMILANHLASAEHVRRFRAEAKAAAGLKHPNILDIHEVGQVHGQHYFVMQYVDGRSLAQRLASGNVDLETAVCIIAKVARAVAYLHRQGLVHRDLKPSNILLDDEDEPYVTDFGLAKALQSDSDLTATGVIAGTPSYMSPEQAAGRRDQIGHLSDVYSMGVILYELLTGRPPFREENPFDTLLQVVNREPTLPRQLNRRIPQELELICLQCLAKSPEDRYPSAIAVAEDLEHFLKGEALTTRPPHPFQRLWRWARREPALASRLGVLAIFFVVESVNYHGARIVPLWFHQRILAIMALWCVAAFGFQQFLKLGRWSSPAQFVWGLIDSALLLAVLLIADGVASPLVACYPLIIVGSGLWFRVRIVWFVTFVSLASYWFLVFDFYYRRWSELYVERGMAFAAETDRHVIFAVMLFILGALVAYLVQRVRALSQYYGPRP